MTILEGDARRAALAPLVAAGWREVEDGRAIARDFAFDGFPAAFAWMTRIALAAETMNHHPDWSNSYTRVAVRLTSHDAGGLTERDVRLATIMDDTF